MTNWKYGQELQTVSHLPVFPAVNVAVTASDRKTNKQDKLN